jgi:hypothetical protein
MTSAHLLNSWFCYCRSVSLYFPFSLYLSNLLTKPEIAMNLVSYGDRDPTSRAPVVHEERGPFPRIMQRLHCYRCFLSFLGAAKAAISLSRPEPDAQTAVAAIVVLPYSKPRLRGFHLCKSWI